MSNDLISRRDLISHIENQYRFYGEEYDAVQILSDIEDFEIAYDLDKVAEQILNIEVDLLSGRNNGKTLFAKTLSEYRRMVIDIVKAGGVE